VALAGGQVPQVEERGLGAAAGEVFLRGVARGRRGAGHPNRQGELQSRTPTGLREMQRQQQQVFLGEPLCKPSKAAFTHRHFPPFSFGFPSPFPLHNRPGEVLLSGTA